MKKILNFIKKMFIKQKCINNYNCVNCKLGKTVYDNGVNGKTICKINAR